MLDKIKNFYDDHEENIKLVGWTVGMSCLSFLITIPFLLILDKLGFNVKNK